MRPPNRRHQLILVEAYGDPTGGMSLYNMLSVFVVNNPSYSFLKRLRIAIGIRRASCKDAPIIIKRCTILKVSAWPNSMWIREGVKLDYSYNYTRYKW